MLLQDNFEKLAQLVVSFDVHVLSQSDQILSYFFKQNFVLNNVTFVAARFRVCFLRLNIQHRAILCILVYFL